ncbi:uncharacterized protein LOC136089314 isoform X2 [Hydra vulgaris]|uniref:Uncharacterized protein LOC136089314 isoform X2 n=1 Tax=Hydra vulgaris TaxID=6087 RepID=A0ABM4DAF6_HYDVU
MPHIKRCQNPGTNWLFFVLIQNFGSAESYISCDSIKTCSESESDHNPQLGKRKYNQIYSFAYQNQFEKRFANARTSKKKRIQNVVNGYRNNFHTDGFINNKLQIMVLVYLHTAILQQIVPVKG